MADETMHWHFDKRINVALLSAIFVQTLGAVWWAAGLSYRVDALERTAVAAGPRLESVIRLEMQVGEIHNTVTEIKAALQQRQAPR